MGRSTRRRPPRPASRPCGKRPSTRSKVEESVARWASPSSTKSMPRKRTDTLHAGFTARLRDLSVPGPLVKYSALSTQTAPTPAECGRPSGRTVATKNVRSASGVSWSGCRAGGSTAVPRTRIGRDCASRSARSWCQSYPCVEVSRNRYPNRRKSSVSVRLDRRRTRSRCRQGRGRWTCGRRWRRSRAWLAPGHVRVGCSSGYSIRKAVITPSPNRHDAADVSGVLPHWPFVL
jgi:hypothetical protein